DSLDAENLERCTQIAAEAQKIRGFEVVKIEAAERVRREVDAQMVRLKSGSNDTVATHTVVHDATD
ncbi:MAG: hypothetical protein HOC05_07535, partial [Gemmatimonadetes bacterium]|nr:hypothetical protein [Gemmatimonadota bacterium]